jgi:hypothetical protein
MRGSLWTAGVLAGHTMVNTVERNEILAAEAERQRALINLDMASLHRLFDDSLVHIHSNGMVHDKSGLLAHIESRKAFVAIVRPALDLRVFDAVAILTGPIRNTMRDPVAEKEVVLEGLVTQVLHREGHNWRFVQFQFTATQPK